MASRRDKHKPRKGRRRPIHTVTSDSGTRVDWHADGSRTVHLNDHGTAALREHLAMLEVEFPRRYGRPMRGDDPLFPDFDAPGDEPVAVSPAKTEAAMVNAMHAVGIDPAQIYAFQQTGLLLTEENEAIADPTAVAEWYAAAERYDRVHTATR